MPSRIVFRRGVRGGRVTQFYRRGAVVPGGQTKRVAPGPVRNAPIYAYQPYRSAARKLVHFNPLVSGSVVLYCNYTSALVPTAQACGMLLNGIPQGDGLDQRHANKAYMRELQVSWALTGYTNSIQANRNYNVVVVYDRESRGTSPALSDIFDDQTSCLSQQRVVNRERFDILFRKSYAVALPQVYDGTSLVNYIDHSWEAHQSFKIPVSRMAIYSGATVGLGDILKGGLFLFAWGENVANVNNLQLVLYPRLEFVDVE